MDGCRIGVPDCFLCQLLQILFHGRLRVDICMTIIYFVVGPDQHSVQSVVRSLINLPSVHNEKFKTEPIEGAVHTVGRGVITQIFPEKGEWPDIAPTIQSLRDKKVMVRVLIAVDNWNDTCTRLQRADYTLNAMTAAELLKQSYRSIFGAVMATGVDFEVTPLPHEPFKTEGVGHVGQAKPKEVAKTTPASNKLVLSTWLAPGDTVMLTAAVRDLHKAYPDRFLTDVCTTAPQIWENNKYITKLKWHKEKRDVADEKGRIKNRDVIVPDEDGVTVIEMHYSKDYAASVNHSDAHAYHFIHGYTQHLESALGLRIPVTDFKGDIHLSKQEKSWINQIEETGEKRPFWIMVAGGKYDFSTKWYPTEYYQAVVDHFKDRVLFVQVGEAAHWHPRLKNVIDLVGKTDTRQFIRLMYHADGVVCPIPFAMHLAAAVETKPGKPAKRPCVVIAGGREPPQWEAYPHHFYLHSLGCLPCCQDKACWVSRCQTIGDGDEKDDPKNLCKRPVRVGEKNFAECMTMITPQDVIRSLEKYLTLDKIKASS
jgi:ADP-heptose:LPS heptosyltransferase